MEQFKDEILHEAAYVTLINDSVYAIRSHKKHLETLEELHKDRHSLDLIGHKIATNQVIWKVS
jgi:hypothetical protein